MKEKVLKLDGDCELRGELEIVFHENNSSDYGELYLSELNTGVEFSINIWGKLKAPEFFTRSLPVCSIVFDDKNLPHLTLERINEKNIFTPELFALLFRDLEKFVAYNWGDIELEKKTALIEWIEKEKKFQSRIRTYNKIRGCLDNDREKNLSNPEVVAALNHLARALGLLPRKTTLYLVRPGYPESKEAKRILDHAGIEYSVLQHAFEDNDKPVLLVHNQYYIGLDWIKKYVKFYSEGGNKLIAVNDKLEDEK